MKKITLLSVFCFHIFFSQAQQINSNIFLNDCSGNTHNLFSDLDAGKIIVLDFVSPSSSSFSTTSGAYSLAQRTASSAQGRIKYFTCSDGSAMDCNGMNAYKSAASVPGAICISDPAFSQSGFGTTGNQKIVVISGSDHKIIYNSNNTINQTAFSSAIRNSISSPAGISPQEHGPQMFKITQDISTRNSYVSFFLNFSCDLKVDVFNLIGEKVKTVYAGASNPGEYRFELGSDDFEKGIYFVRVVGGDYERTGKFSVAR